jgi:carboxymethylenebutenolidase
MPATTGMKGAGYYDRHSEPADSRDCPSRRSCLGLGQITSSLARRGADEMETETTLSSVWDQHIAAEFGAKSADQALATMTAEPHVNEVPLMIGARGREELHDFYANHFLNQIPPDMEMVPVSRTFGQGRGVEEMIVRFTHSIRMDWLLPGIAPTGKRVELPFIVVVQFEGDKMAHEHLYWDQASVLVQVGLLERTLPVRGGETAAQVLNPTQPMNELIRRATSNAR